MRKDRYWDARLERWGAWRVGAGGAKVATWANLRPGSPLSHWTGGDEALPKLFLEERETHALIGHLPPDLRAFAAAAYPTARGLAKRLGLHPDAVHSRCSRLHRLLARLLDQRKRGEPLDIERRPPRPRRARPRLGRSQVASAVLDD